MSKNVSGGAFEVVRDAIASYQRQADKESWKDDHDAAMKCFDLEDILWVGNGIFDAITQFDESYRARCQSGSTEYDPSHGESIKNAYRWWLVSGQKLTARIHKCRKIFGNVANSEEFLSRYREATGILTDDAEFFSGEALIVLRDEAVNAFRTGDFSECGSSE